MSYLRFEDHADGIQVFFDDVTDAGPVGTTATFNESKIATLTRTPHTIKFSMDFVDGPANDVVKIYIDDTLKATGKSWEDYYRYDPEQTGGGNKVPTVDSLIVRAAGTAVPTNANKGYLFDNFSLSSSTPTPIVRSAEITVPTAGSTVSGVVNFSAYLTDDDVDAIQWAVRQGTCAAGTGTVFGNVDGKSNIATIDTSNVENQTFSFSGDMSSMTPGTYCFVYNPVEDSGESDIRLTSQFNLVAIDTTAPTVPTHISPANNIVLTQAELQKIDWSDVTDPSTPVVYYYESSNSSETDSNGAFVMPAYQSGALTLSEIATPGTPEGEWYWHVRAVDNAGNSSAWSTPWHITVDNTPPVVQPEVPTTKEECMNNGWQNFTHGFKNQGQCVSYIQANDHAKKH